MLKSVVVCASHVGGGRAGSSPAVISPDRKHIVCLRRICCAGSSIPAVSVRSSASRGVRSVG